MQARVLVKVQGLGLRVQTGAVKVWLRPGLRSWVGVVEARVRVSDWCG